MNLPQRSNLVTGAAMQADQHQLGQSVQLQQSMEARRAEPQLPQTMAAAQRAVGQTLNTESQQQLLASQLALAAKESIQAAPLQAGLLPGKAGSRAIAAQAPAGIDPRVYLMARTGQPEFQKLLQAALG